jgi:hypothetical protein
MSTATKKKPIYNVRVDKLSKRHDGGFTKDYKS